MKKWDTAEEAKTMDNVKQDLFRVQKKYLIPFCVLFLTLTLSWGTWVTKGVFMAKADMAEVKKSVEGINKDTDQLQLGQKELNKKIEENKDTIYKSNKEILEKLMEIQKDIKRNSR